MAEFLWAAIFEKMLLWVTFNITETTFCKRVAKCVYLGWCIGDNFMDGSCDFMVT